MIQKLLVMQSKAIKNKLILIYFLIKATFLNKKKQKGLNLLIFKDLQYKVQNKELALMHKDIL